MKANIGILKKCGGCGSMDENNLQLVYDKKKNRGYLCKFCNKKFEDLLMPDSIRNFWMCNACKYRVLAGTEIDAKVDTEYNEKCPHCGEEILNTLVNLHNDHIIDSGIFGEPLE